MENLAAEAVPTVPPTTRRRSVVALFTGVALTNTAMTGATTAGTLVAAEAGAAEWSGLPSAAGVAGTAAGALGLGVLIARRGARPALLAAYALAVAGGVLAGIAAALGSLLALLAGLVLLGLGNAAALLSRYVAAELYPAARKGFGLSTVVWAGTVGAVVGPPLIAPTAAAAERVGLPPLSGPVLAAVVLMAAALAVTVALPATGAVVVREAGPPAAVGVLRRPAVLAPLTAMVAAQLAMVAVMTMTPVQLHHHGHGLDVVGWVLTAHILGMFALAPLSGRIADRWGGRVTIFAGIGTLAVASVTAMAAPTAHTSGLPLALFLLGYGWNLVFVGGSTLLSRDLPAERRSRVQGVVDAVVWGASALAGVSAGQLFGAGGYMLVAGVAGALAVAPLVLLARRPR
ncbi:Predicted arabinose efflux permease, MFS family [Amycolatopsis arida]|uniref:Predicted arabinose efflux permease, MFS family n=1 Tax=Amycolatopsis arida TaxID=587909 RepID=A0A1I5LUP6_9PSEU|nr:MFS transporter [Amycolatopsis arida]TDX93850.1 putative MFS family arabinose efflux permease [Amycolatopsis arida]SFP00877.1 Predicted arabinose efflux permease, MFS family [Amycolatopsis arida]